MCGRITVDLGPDEIAQWLNVDTPAQKKPRLNIAKTELVRVLRISPDTGKRELVEMRWGFVPAWAQDVTKNDGHMCARSESIYSKRSFCNAIRIRRCIIPVSGFYEWDRSVDPKQTYKFGRADCKPIALAGIWERNDFMPGGSVETFAIVTIEPNELLATIHDRMPVILPDDRAIEHWLDPKEIDASNLLKTYPADLMTIEAVEKLTREKKDGSQVLPSANEESDSIKPRPSRRRKESPDQGFLFN